MSSTSSILASNTLSAAWFEDSFDCDEEDEDDAWETELLL
jgi:hypothetical protein